MSRKAKDEQPETVQEAEPETAQEAPAVDPADLPIPEYGGKSMNQISAENRARIS